MILPALQSAALNVKHGVRSFALQRAFFCTAICGVPFTRLPVFFFAIHRRFLDQVSACKIPLRPRTEAVFQAYTGELKAPSDAAIPAKVDHVLAIIFQHAWIFGISGLDPSIQFSIMRRKTYRQLSFHFNITYIRSQFNASKHSCILFDECCGLCIARMRWRPRLARWGKTGIDSRCACEDCLRLHQ